MKADFFIDRPVFSTVLSIIIVIVGAIGLALLPVDQYPQIVPPVVRVSASYPGADAQTVTQAGATPIEQELNGTPGMIYMESSSSNSGGFSATVTFDISVDPDLAAVDVQNRLKKAEARLPAEVVQNGISVEKQAASKLMGWFQLAMSQSEGNHAHAVLNNGKSTNMDHHSPPSSLQPKTMEAPLRETVRTLPTKKVCAMINSDTSSKREVLVVSMCSHAGV